MLTWQLFCGCIDTRRPEEAGGHDHVDGAAEGMP